ncbi:MAG TPA: type II secretion system protein [Pyrinomonadaceae bacterium]|nr:type II secretion system protein [Pyrinomonadaceae bacterium]
MKREVERKSHPTLSPSPRLAVAPSRASRAGGWTLIELVITMTVMTVLTMAVIPIVRTSIRRQREARLHDALRQMRNAIDEFKRDTVGMQCGPGGTAIVTPPGTPGVPGAPGGGYIDPRSRVVISDCKIFGVENPDRYPPSLDTLVEGVDVIQRPGAGAGPLPGAGLTGVGGSATENSGGAIPKKKRYLREIPIDPMTGKPEWCILSNYDEADGGCSSSANNVFDVRSNAKGEALNGEKYSDW